MKEAFTMRPFGNELLALRRGRLKEKDRGCVVRAQLVSRCVPRFSCFEIARGSLTCRDKSCKIAAT